jgi:hypothetical protein
MHIRNRAVIAALASSVAALLVGCDRGATSNPNAPGSPGVGNAPEVRAPSAPDTPPGGPSGVKGSLPHPGSSGGDVVRGTSGSGTDDPSGRSQTAQPGSGLQGGLGGNAGMSATGTSPSGTSSTSTAPGGSGPAGGSGNRTSSGAVGQR